LTLAGGVIGTSAITLVQGTAPTPTAEGVIEWETDDDHIIIGDGSAQVEFVPAEDVSGDITMTDAGVTTIAANAVTSAKINDDEIVNADINSAAAIAISKTALIGGTNITIATNTLNVDDAFVINSGSDVMAGTLTADGLTLGSTELLTIGAQTLIVQ